MENKLVSIFTTYYNILAAKASNKKCGVTAEGMMKVSEEEDNDTAE